MRVTTFPFLSLLAFGLLSTTLAHTSNSSQVSYERAAGGKSANYEFYLADDVTPNQKLSLWNWVAFVVVIVVIVLLIYAYYKCYNRNSRQHARSLATLPLQPQFPIGATQI